MSDQPKSNQTYIIGAVAVVAILAVAGVAYAMNNNSKKDETPNKSDQSMMKSDTKTQDKMVAPQDNTAMMKPADDKMMPDKMMTSEETVKVGGAAMYKNKNIIDNVVNAPNLSTLVAAVKAADLVTTLQGPGPFTVFGPDNAAFDKLPKGTVETLLLPENKTKLQNILKYHVVAGKILSTDLKDGQILTTVQGEKLTVKVVAGKVTIQGADAKNIATITTPDVLQSNGVAHVIDTVLLPATK
jgi:uncharacterized surface protein with fasciclin (FAS1) repeats